MKGRAHLSPCGTYRYQLHRDELRPALMPPPKRVTFVMLNPSTADAEEDDPTIRRCIGFALREGGSSLTVVNLYALRATDPNELLRHPAPIGPDNDAAILDGCRGAELVILAWGAHRAARSRAPRMLGLLAELRADGGLGLVCTLGLTKLRAPRHPLYLAADTPLEMVPSA